MRDGHLLLVVVALIASCAVQQKRTAERDGSCTDAARPHAFLDAVREQPEANPVLDRDTRRVLISRFPYGLLFRTVGDTIVSSRAFTPGVDPHRGGAGAEDRPSAPHRAAHMAVAADG